jgi:hypothetical protein
MDIRLCSASDLDEINERARIARTDQPEPDPPTISPEGFKTEPVATQLEPLLWAITSANLKNRLFLLVLGLRSAHFGRHRLLVLFLKLSRSLEFLFYLGFNGVRGFH